MGEGDQLLAEQNGFTALVVKSVGIKKVSSHT